MHGEIEEGAVISDKTTGKSRGYGFITFKHMESAHNALKAPSKMIDVSISQSSIFAHETSHLDMHVDLSFSFRLSLFLSERMHVHVLCFENMI